MITPLQPKQITLNPKAAFVSRRPVAQPQAPKGDTLSLRFSGFGQAFAPPVDRVAELHRYLLKENLVYPQSIQKLFDAQKMSINDQDKADSATIVHRVVEKDRLDLVKPLVDCGANLNIQDTNGLTPLALAAKAGKTGMVKCLLDAGADPNIATKEGFTPLHWLVVAGSVEPEILAELVQKGANPNLQNKYGNTPLHNTASSLGNFAKAKALLEVGADPLIKENNQRTVLEEALRNNNLNIAKLIVESTPFTQNRSDKEQLEIFKNAVFKVLAEKR